MFQNYSIVLFTSILALSICNHAHAFEPVSIEDFFQKFESPQNKNSEQVSPQSDTSYQQKIPNKAISLPKNPPSPSHHITHTPKKNQDTAITKVSFPKYNTALTAFSYPTVQVIVIDRILGRSEIIKFSTGTTNLVADRFKVTINNCIQRKTEFGNSTHSVNMKISQINLQDSTQSDKIRYHDIFYLEMPGFRGFEDVTYDIKPIKCEGNPKKISLRQANKLNNVPDPQETTDSMQKNINQKQLHASTQSPIKNKKNSQKKIETIISNAHIRANL